MSSRNLVLTGMMGSGKSTVGDLVAKSLGKPFVDTDVEIEKRFGQKIADIFRTQGESAFRKAEADLCSDLAHKNGLVIATGGGFLVPAASQEAMKNHLIFCLDASAECLLERTKSSSHRPLAPKIKELLVERQGAYQRIFHHIDTNKKSAKEVSDEIIRRANLDEKFAQDRMRLVQMPQLAPYPIVVKDGIVSELWDRLLWIGIEVPRLIVVTNEKLKSLYADRFGKKVEWLVIPDGEQFKTLETVHKLYGELMRIKAKRDDVLVAFGGGIVGDVAGFVAATFMRGIRFVQIPTTLLAMVDSSIGGKTGVDLPQAKNLVGAFKQPLMVLADPTLLATLPKEEFSAGMAEVIKHAMIGDAALFEKLEGKDEVDLCELIFRALLVKAEIVEDDPFEQGRRALLNLGHTFGHAFETVSAYSIRHGEAVAIGLVAACELAHRLGLSDLRSRVEKVLAHHHLSTRLPKDMNKKAIMDAFGHDKKATHQGLRFIVPHGLSDIREAFIDDRPLLSAVLDSI